MKPTIKYFGRIEKGKKIYNNPSLYSAQLNQLEGQEFEEIIRKRSRKTTLSQHAYYRGIILPICHQNEMFSHYDKPDDIHEDYFGEKFLSYTKIITMPDGSKREKTAIKSTADMPDDETSKFIEKVVMECANLGITILTPEEYYNQNL